MANYTYDAWGKVLSVTNSSGTAITSSTSIGNVNPLRYRGYFYDTETGFYYCNSRYYDPAVRRFINADNCISTDQGFIGDNMYAYCLNNPVMRIDVLGELSKWFPMVLNHDWGYFHRAVQAHIVSNNEGVRSEVSLKNLRRMDIYMTDTHEVWEVKYDNVAGTGELAAYDSLQKYVGEKYESKTVIMGQSGKFSGAFVEEVFDNVYTVTYSTPNAGVVLYDFKEQKSRQEAEATAAAYNAAAAAATAVVVGFGAAAGGGTVGVGAPVPVGVGGGALINIPLRQNMFI